VTSTFLGLGLGKRVGVRIGERAGLIAGFVLIATGVVFALLKYLKVE
jgi:putative Mn2+ efflux pump MntP